MIRRKGNKNLFYILLHSFVVVTDILVVFGNRRVSNVQSYRIPSFTSSTISTNNNMPTPSTTTTNGGDEESVPAFFDESVLSYDHYNGVTLDLGKYYDWEQQQQRNTTKGDNNTINNNINKMDPLLSLSFAERLQQAVHFWKSQGRKGLWIHVPPMSSHWIPDCIQAGFGYHKVVVVQNNDDDRDNDSDDSTHRLKPTTTTTTTSTLVLSQWLPQDVPSKLPLGPTHQVGVGVVVLNPSDPSQMLCVKERSGPAAAYDLWKMPTGLLDPGEDIPAAAVRELEEETSLQASSSLQGIVCFRQAHYHGNNNNNNNNSAIITSDLFFVCHVTLKDETNIQWKPQEDEIVAIQWMSVQDFCDQERWQGSPLYTKLNDCILQLSQAAVASVAAAKKKRPQHLDDVAEAAAAASETIPLLPRVIEHQQLPVGFGRAAGMTNALFLVPPLPASTCSSSSHDSSSSKL